MARNAGVIMTTEMICDQYEMKLQFIYSDCIEYAKARLYREQFGAFVPTVIPGANQGDPATVTSFIKTQITLEQFEDAIIEQL